MVSDRWGPQLHVFGSGPSRWPPGTFPYPEGSLRHGWYSPGEGWRFETLLEGSLEVGVNVETKLPGIAGKTASWVGPDRNQNVVAAQGFGDLCPYAETCSAIAHFWYDGSGWKADAPGFACGDFYHPYCGPTASGAYPAIALNPVNSNVELFSKALGTVTLSHLFWKGRPGISGPRATRIELKAVAATTQPPLIPPSVRCTSSTRGPTVRACAISGGIPHR